MNIGEAKVITLLAMIKTSGDPLVEGAGAYFPAWLACMGAGAAGTWLLHEVAFRTNLALALHPVPLMIPCVFAGITSATWLVFFAVA